MHKHNPTARPGGWRSKGTERGLSSLKEQRQRRLPVPRNSSLCSSRPATADTSLPPVSSPCNVTQFKQVHAKWFSLIQLVEGIHEAVTALLDLNVLFL